MSYLIDTDVLIDGLSGQPQAFALLEELVPYGVAVSIISLGELYEGAFIFAEPHQHVASLRRFLSGFEVLGLTDAIMERFARERAALRQNGALIPDFDLLIAATALTHNRSLVTRNRRHFGRVPALKLYQLEPLP